MQGATLVIAPAADRNDIYPGRNPLEWLQERRPP